MATLFDPVSVGSLSLDNRIALAPMTRSRGTPDHLQSELAATYYAQRAGAGLLITEGTPVSQEGVGYIHVPGIWSDAQVEAWKPVTEAVHAEGSTIFAQIWHVGRISHTTFQPDERAPVAPSALAANAQAFTGTGFQPTSTPTALDEAGIRRIVGDFAAAARRAVDAGFDGVEIHGANGYLLEQFLYTGSNTRTDGYGGSPANRARFTLEVVDAVIEAIGGERVGLRLSPQNTFNDSHDDDRKATFAALASELARRPLAFLHIVEPVSTPEADRIAPSLRAAFDGTVLLNGGYDATTARAALENGDADLIAFGSSFISNPDLPARLRLGAPLVPPNPETFYTPGPEGYTDYPALDTPYVHWVAMEITDQDGYTRYRDSMRRILRSFGGRFLFDAHASQILVGDPAANRVFALAFPSEEASDRFFADPAYAAVRAEHFDGSVGAVSRLGAFTPAG